MSEEKEYFPQITLEAQIREAKRELAMRERLYPKWVASETSRMTQARADEQIIAMRNIVRTLENLKAQRDPQMSLL